VKFVEQPKLPDVVIGFVPVTVIQKGTSRSRS
jgi:hypothetical protein